MSGPGGADGVAGTVYLLHFDRPYRHARHYRGWTTDLDARLAEHAAGRGARLVAVIAAAGIGFTLARTWPGTRSRERQLKRQGGAARNCPLCGITPRPTRPTPATAVGSAAGDAQHAALPPPLRSPVSSRHSRPHQPCTANIEEAGSTAMSFPWIHPSELDAARAEAAHDLAPTEAQRAVDDYYRRAYEQWLAGQAAADEPDRETEDQARTDDELAVDTSHASARAEYNPAAHTLTEPGDIPRCATCSEPGSHADCMQAELDAAERDPGYRSRIGDLDALRQARDAARAREEHADAAYEDYIEGYPDGPTPSWEQFVAVDAAYRDYTEEYAVGPRPSWEEFLAARLADSDIASARTSPGAVAETEPHRQHTEPELIAGQDHAPHGDPPEGERREGPGAMRRPAGHEDYQLPEQAEPEHVDPAGDASEAIRRAQRAVNELAQRRIGEDRRAAEQARGEQLARWHAEDRAAEQQQAADLQAAGYAW